MRFGRLFTTRQIAVAGMLGALVGLLGLTPLGLIPVPTPAGSVTILHIPVILAAVLEGPWVGGMVGFFFGFISWWRAVTAPANPVAQVIFSDPITAFGPRILIGPLAYGAMMLAKSVRARPVVALVIAVALGDMTYRTMVDSNQLAALLLALALGGAAGWGMYVLLRGQAAGPGLAAVVGTLTNTVGVLSLVVARGILPPQAALAIGTLHGLPEVVAAVMLTVLIYRGLARVNLVRSGGHRN